MEPIGRPFIDTPHGRVHVGDRIHIRSVKKETAMLAAFPDGIDHHAEALEGRQGVVEYIGGNALRGTWGGLSVLTDLDDFEVIS